VFSGGRKLMCVISLEETSGFKWLRAAKII
jgi:hypothetical protein